MLMFKHGNPASVESVVMGHVSDSDFNFPYKLQLLSSVTEDRK